MTDGRDDSSGRSDDVEYHSRRRRTLSEPGDSVLVRQTATELAADIGFEDETIEEIGLVAAELAENVHDHTAGGELVIAHISTDDREGIRLESRDSGSGIETVEAGFGDGVSSTDSLGGGLGTVNRLMDRITLAGTGEPHDGTAIVTDRWMRPAYEQTVECPLDFGAASRPKSPDTPNGDSFVIKRWDDHALVGVIDGLGHGLGAHKAATAARVYIERHFDQPLETVYEGVDRACRGTRGVVMALARFDWIAETVTVAGIGNIAIKLTGPDANNVVMRRGVIGSNPPDPSIQTLEWQPEYRMVMQSDGISTRWSWEDCDDLKDESATVGARRLLRRFGKDDDATILIVAPHSPQ